ncbi:hypothetical protein U1Q18_028323 [Sarracenia purpurea var. burkii]
MYKGPMGRAGRIGRAVVAEDHTRLVLLTAKVMWVGVGDVRKIALHGNGCGSASASGRVTVDVDGGGGGSPRTG